MGKINDFMEGRNQGILLAYKIAQESGIYGLKKEIEYRNLMNVSLNVTKSEIKVAEANMRYRTTEVAIVFALITLLDEFNFSKLQARKFKEKFDDMVNTIINDDGTLIQLINRAKEELDIDMVVRK